MSKIVVAGAGLAGLAAARQLAARGHEVTGSPGSCRRSVAHEPTIRSG